MRVVHTVDATEAFVLGSLTSALTRVASIEARMARLGLWTGQGVSYDQGQSIDAPAAGVPPVVTTPAPARVARPSRAREATGAADTFAQALATESSTRLAAPASRRASQASSSISTRVPESGSLANRPTVTQGVAPDGTKQVDKATTARSVLAMADAVPDPRWTEVLDLAAASLAAGARGPATPSTPIPAYAGTLSSEVEARRRSDGSLNPNDLPSSEGLAPDELLLARLANGVPNAVLALGQNEGVTAPGATPSVNDSYDLLAWIAELQAMAAGTVPPYVQGNGYTWTHEDVERNLQIALDNVRQNKVLYNMRWETRWEMLRTAGYSDVADQEQATVTLVDPNGAPGVV